MKTLFSLDNWTMIKKISPDKRMAFATIYVKYPNWKMVAKLDLPDRKKFRDKFLKTNFQKLIDRKYFDTYEVVGTKRRPSGVKAKLTLASILKLTKQSFIENIFIHQLDGAKEKQNKPTYNFFCVKMTVSIQVEGLTKGMQSCEDRYVLVKAQTVESAYNKVKKQEKQYGEPYLNSDARLVRWKIESYDDCFAMNITSIDDFNKPEGVEVFSKLRSRKITSDRAWSGR
ncbi:hypothetical protein A4D02_35600 [Niastella koreensis]|nr:DUF4288 domain-containing protein [Niastella koreensis]OQP44205.1 hypothetical protein A4D02_35600 [Niastella koreensis]